MAFTAKILSWRFRHLNIVGCLLKRRPTKGGSRAPQEPASYAPVKNVNYNRLQLSLEGEVNSGGQINCTRGQFNKTFKSVIYKSCF